MRIISPIENEEVIGEIIKHLELWEVNFNKIAADFGRANYSPPQ